MFSIILPTYNESENIVEIVRQIDGVLAASGREDYHLWVMDDDSPDETWKIAEGLRNPRVRVVNRRGKVRGLSAAVLDGFSQADGDFFIVMDADLSHPPQVLPRLVEAIEAGAWVAVGSRYVKGGGVENWPWHRRLVSRGSCLLARPVTPVRDATSGFFAVRRQVVEGVSLSPLGFKIGLEVFVKGKHGGKAVEVPYVFTDRRAGESKLSSKVMSHYLRQLAALILRKRSA